MPTTNPKHNFTLKIKNQKKGWLPEPTSICAYAGFSGDGTDNL